MFIPEIRVNPKYNVNQKIITASSSLKDPKSSRSGAPFFRDHEAQFKMRYDISVPLDNKETLLLLEAPNHFSSRPYHEIEEALNKASQLAHYEPLNPNPKEFSKCLCHYKRNNLEEHDEFLKNHKNKMRELTNFQKKSLRTEEMHFLNHRERTLVHSTQEKNKK